MLLYIFRSAEGLHSDQVHATLLEPVLVDGRFYCSQWTLPIAICNCYSKATAIVYLEKGECKPIRLERLKAIITAAGKFCPELDELEEYDNRRKEILKQELLKHDILT